MNKFEKLMGDPFSYFFIKGFQLKSMLYTCICTIYTYFLSNLKGVSIGKNNSFNGCPYIVRSPYSKIKIGDNCIVNSAFKSNNIGVFSRSRIVTDNHGAEILIGNNVGMTSVTLFASEKIEIGDGCLIGGNVLITDSDWHSLDYNDRNNKNKIGRAPVIVGKNVFIGTRSIILKGVEIGDNSVIGAGSVVSKSIPANVIAAGNPCKIIKNI